MDLTTISAELKEKTKEFRSLEKTYKAALSWVNKEHAKAKIMPQLRSIRRLNQSSMKLLGIKIDFLN